MCGLMVFKTNFISPQSSVKIFGWISHPHKTHSATLKTTMVRNSITTLTRSGQLMVSCLQLFWHWMMLNCVDLSSVLNRYFCFANNVYKSFNRNRYTTTTTSGRNKTMSDNDDEDTEQSARESVASPSPSQQGLRASRRNGSPSSSTTPPIISAGTVIHNRNAYTAEEEASVGDDSSESLAYVQLDAYNVDPKSLYELHDTQKDYLSRVVRTQIFSRVKFLPKSGKEHEKIFGSFWKPDLLGNTPKYIDAILDNFADLKQRKDDEYQLTAAVHFWMNASYLVRQVILDRRSNVTQRMKRELIVGMCICNCLCIVCFL